MGFDPAWARAQVRQTAAAKAWPAEALAAAMERLDLLEGEWGDIPADEWWGMAAGAMLQISAAGADKLAASFRNVGQGIRNKAQSGDDNVFWNTAVASSQDARAIGQTAGKAAADVAAGAASAGSALGDVAKANPTGLLAVGGLLVLLLLARK